MGRKEWKHAFMLFYCNYQGTWKSGDAIVMHESMLLCFCTAITKVHENQVMQYEEYFQTFVLQLSRYMKIRWIQMKIYFYAFSKWCDLTRFCLYLDGGGILELFYLYSKIPDSFGRWRNFGSVSFVLKIPDIFWCWRNFGSILLFIFLYFIFFIFYFFINYFLYILFSYILFYFILYFIFLYFIYYM